MISRRSILKGLLAAAVLYPLRTANVFASQKTERTLSLYNTHTGEGLHTTYYSAGAYDYEALEKINNILRCHYTNEIKAIDIRVLDLLSDIKDTFGRQKEIRVISGYRSPEYNDHLRSMGRKVAKDSLHMRGLAIDFAMEGVGMGEISGVAKSFASGGVGRYPEFVHIDVGRIRYW